LKDKINELKMNSKYRTVRDVCRGINIFKSGYQTRDNLMRDENGDLLEGPTTF
jgi:hypothetical protein